MSEPSEAVQKLATQIYLSGRCKNLNDAYEKAQAQLGGNGGLFEQVFGDILK